MRISDWRSDVCSSDLNGVGARNFRDAFPACDPEPEEVPAWGSGPAYHAHQIVLEILSETGILGLLCWLAGAALSLRAWRYADQAARGYWATAFLHRSNRLQYSALTACTAVAKSVQRGALSAEGGKIGKLKIAFPQMCRCNCVGSCTITSSSSAKDNGVRT